ncbi:MAG: 6-carboxytetrahydropterin synthase [Candidatus Methanomethylicaceae archaeon]
MAVKKDPSIGRVSVFVEASFDYSHFLPENDRCFPLHGHTSLVNLEINGELLATGMVIDFIEAKRILKETLSLLDHKLVTNRANARSEGNGRITVSYKDFEFHLPMTQVFLLEGEATSESIALAIAEKVIGRMPKNIASIKLTMTEGLRKGTVIRIKRSAKE